MNGCEPPEPPPGVREVNVSTATPTIDETIETYETEILRLRAENARLRELLRESARVHGDDGNQAMEQHLCDALGGKGT
jgi:hypothetical protein